MDGDWEKINRGSDKGGGVEETGKGTGKWEKVTGTCKGKGKGKGKNKE